MFKLITKLKNLIWHIIVLCPPKRWKPFYEKKTNFRSYQCFTIKVKISLSFENLFWESKCVLKFKNRKNKWGKKQKKSDRLKFSCDSTFIWLSQSHIIAWQFQISSNSNGASEFVRICQQQIKNLPRNRLRRR